MSVDKSSTGLKPILSIREPNKSVILDTKQFKEFKEARKWAELSNLIGGHGSNDANTKIAI